jgi:ABC-type uncharacterized transport system involved in gliding motility auxiliary subunit
MTQRAPILGISGLILLFFGSLAHWLTYNPAEGFFAFRWFSATHLVVGLVCLIGQFVAGQGSWTTFLGRRSTRYGANAVLYSLVFVVVFGMINFLGARYHSRIDVTSAGVNSLSDQSRSVIDALEGTVRVDAFVENGANPVLEEMLSAYRYESDKIEFQVIDPQLRPELTQEAGITQVPSLRIAFGERSTVVTAIEEEAITNGIHRVTSAAQKKVYFLEGHGEGSIDDHKTPTGLGFFAAALRNQNYVVEKLFLAETEAVPGDASVVIVPPADREIFAGELELLGNYMRAGGRVMFLLEPQMNAEVVEFLAPWGVEVGNDVILDQQVRLFQGPTLGFEPVVSTYSQHPSVKPLTDRTLFSFARSVRPSAAPPKGIVLDTIALTAKTSWGETNVDRLLSQSEAGFEENSDIAGPVPIAVAASAYVRDIGGEGDAEFEMLVFGDGSFVTNKFWRQLFNDALALAGVGWLAGQEELISIGSRAIRASRAHLTAAQATTVFVLTVIVLPEAILMLGILVWWRRSSL